MIVSKHDDSIPQILASTSNSQLKYCDLLGNTLIGVMLSDHTIPVLKLGYEQDTSVKFDDRNCQLSPAPDMKHGNLHLSWSSHCFSLFEYNFRSRFGIVRVVTARFRENFLTRVVERGVLGDFVVY